MPPDFDVLERASLRPGEARSALFSLLDDLKFAWSNDESLFIYVLMLLLDTDEAAAAIVFATLNTTRARLDLVERLARIKVKDQAVRRELRDIVRKFSAITRLRNELYHATYVVDEAGEITHTQVMKLGERHGEMRFGARQPFDATREEQIVNAVKQLYQLNRRLWALLPQLARDESDVSRAAPGN